MMPNRRKPQAVASAEDALIRCVRTRGTAARSDLADELGLVPSTIGVYVERLVRDGFLLETVTGERGLGRPPVKLRLNPARGRFIGVDFDARNVMGISVDFSQNPLKRLERVLSSPATTEAALQTFKSVIAELINANCDDILGIGVGLPGIVDVESGVGVRCNFLEDWREVPVIDILSREFGVPVYVENNLRSMALAEYWFGEGRGSPRLACLGVRTGIGMGIVIDGRLYRGANHVAGEIGMWQVPDVAMRENPSGPPNISSTGKTIEQLASMSAILTTAAERLQAGESSIMAAHGAPLTTTGYLNALRQADPLAVELAERVAVMHGWIIHHLMMVLDPDILVLAGPLLHSPLYLDPLRAVCKEIGGETLSSRVVPSSLGPFAGALGAAAIAVHNWTPRTAEGDAAK